jgi:hypothetical protein
LWSLKDLFILLLVCSRRGGVFILGINSLKSGQEKAYQEDPASKGRCYFEPHLLSF